ncbi:hypothetical protein ACFV0W_31325, partial [Streptomyces anulatus]
CDLLARRVGLRPTTARPPGSGAAAAVLVLFGLRLLWRFVTARCGGNRCRLNPGGIAVTGPIGGVRDAVVWREVPGLRRTSSASLLMAFHRVEVERRGAPPLTFTALGLEPAVIGVLLRLAARNGLE